MEISEIGQRRERNADQKGVQIAAQIGQEIRQAQRLREVVYPLLRRQ